MEPTSPLKKAVLSKVGLRVDGSPLDGVDIDLYDQVPYDPFHR